MEHKHLSLEWKATEEGVIEGYGCVFDNVDLGGDIIAPGAFTMSLRAPRKVKMLWQHDAEKPIGIWDTLEEDGKGLRVSGRILTEIDKGRESLAMIRAGVIDGLSIGYRTVKSMDRNGKRVIMQADLWEVSLVTFPMNELARIDAVKAAAMTERELERKLTREAGFTRSVALALMAGGYNAVKAMRDAGCEVDELAQFMRSKINAKE